MGTLTNLRKELAKDIERGIGSKNFKRLQGAKKLSKTAKAEFNRRRVRGGEHVTRIINDRYGKKGKK